jgi:hypothetical protein
VLRLPPSDLDRLRTAILNAYPGFVGIANLDIALSAAGVQLARYGNPNTSTNFVLFQAILDQNAQGNIANVIGAVRRGNATDPVLAELEKEWLRTVAAPETTRLEGMVIEQLDFAPGPEWVAKLTAAFRWVSASSALGTQRLSGQAFSSAMIWY